MSKTLEIYLLSMTLPVCQEHYQNDMEVCHYTS